LILFRSVIARRLVCGTIIEITLCVFAIAGPAYAQVSNSPAQAIYDQAVDLLQQGKNADALALIDAALEKGVRDSSLYNLKGLAASELGRNAEAEECFRTVIRLSPKSAMGYNNLGVLLSKLGQSQEAVTNFRNAHARDPQNFTALLGLGTSLAALQQYEEAAGFLQKAAAIRLEDFQASYEWAHALFEIKQPAAAKKVLDKIAVPTESDLSVKYYSLAGAIATSLKNGAAAERAYRSAYSLSPDSYDIYVALAQASLSLRDTSPNAAPPREKLPPAPANLTANQNLTLGLLFLSHDDYSAAIPSLERVLQQDAFNETATLNLAIAYKEVGQSSAAIELTRLALKKKPTGSLYDALAELEEASGHYVEAVQDYQRAVELEPTNEDYYYDLGMEYLSHFTFGPALEVFRVGVQKFPQSSRQFLGLAFSHYAEREYPQAADAFTTALEIEPDSPPVVKAWNTVLSALSPNDWEAILPRLGRLVKAHPENVDLTFYYGAALFRSEFAKGSTDFAQPQMLLEKSIKLRANFAAARIELGGLYAAQKQDAKAVEEYLEATLEDPKSEVPHYKLGQIYRQMNKLDLATTELARYQELSRLHQEEIKHNRSAIQQFVLAQPAKINN
jgi:tetratricopeptide (TPR) repeat protein